MGDTPYKPLEGDPDLLISKANHYNDIADAIARSVVTLKKIHDVDDMVSKATEKLKDKSDDVADDITKAHDRYATTANALLTYAAALRIAQDHANTAITSINAKQATVDSANKAASTAKTTAENSKADSKTTDQAAATKAQSAATDAQTDLENAQGAWHDAYNAKNAAAKTAKDAIDYVVNGKGNHGLKDVHHWYDGVVHFVEGALKVFKKICDIAGILSIFLAWVPILGEVLLALAAVGALLDFITAGIDLAEGKGGWGDFLMAGIGAVMAVCGGKLIEMAGKGLKGVMVARAAKALEDQGADVDRGLRALQGVGAHSSEEYTTAADAVAAKNELKETFSSFSHFRTSVSKAFKESFNPAADGSTKMETFRDGMKEAFTPSGLVNSDLVSMVKMGIKDPSLVDGKLVAAGLGVTGLQVVKDIPEIHEQIEAHRDHAYVIPGMGSGYVAISKAQDMVTEAAGGGD